ncbi:mRNA-capping enzyme [Nymphon striatum]|nr:mRNA-capping enzyme [Nymphon striatum]
MNKRRFNPDDIPPRWLNCPRKGYPIDKFIPFKTPLSSRYDGNVPEESRFSPSMFVSSLTSYKCKLGLWIDLTNTKRFYNSEDIEKMEIHYLKLQCKGHGECPAEDVVRSFIGICDNFIRKNPVSHIGKFARPPGIYKQSYLEELFRRYGDPEDTPPAPTLPDWCSEEDDSGRDDDGNDINEEIPVKKFRKEFNKKQNPMFMVEHHNIVSITTQPKLIQIQKKVQAMCNWTRNGFPGSQPVSMDRSNIYKMKQKHYMVSWKADGSRYMMLIDGENEIYFVDRDNAIFQVHGLTFPYRKDPNKHICNTLVDGEMIIDKVNDTDILRYLIYDIIRFEGEEVGGTDFRVRLLCIGKELIGPRREAMEKGKIDRPSEPFSVRLKEFYEVHHAKTLLSKDFTVKLAHEIDGLIFQPSDPYVFGQSDSVLKWKPASLNSIDFKLQIFRENRLGMLPQAKGLLFVGGMNDCFSEMKVTRDLKAYDKKIIECNWEGNQWKFMRERTDKSFPNSYKTAMAVLESIRQPVTEEILFSVIDECTKEQKKHQKDRTKI